MDINTAKQVLLRTHASALALNLRPHGYHMESGPGVGKTDGTHQMAAELARAINEPVGIVVSMLATISSVDVRGFMLPVKNAAGGMDTVFSTPPWYPTKANTVVTEPDGKLHREGTWTGDTPRVGIVFLDEFSQAEDDVKKPAAELVLRGQVGNCALPLGWRVISAGNRISDRSGVLRELMFIVNRRCKLSIDASLPAWLTWANAREPAHRPHYLTMSFAQKNPDIVFKDTMPEGSDPFCTPRTLCMLDRDMMALRSDQDVTKNRLPIDPVSREVATGWIGGASAAQFFTHLKYADELPEMTDIERDPEKAKLPEARDAQMVCGYMLAHNATGKNAEKVIAYIGRLGIEMQVLAMRAVLAQPEHAAEVINTKGMTNWLRTNNKLLVASRA